jgi:hypothetical protein
VKRYVSLAARGLLTATLPLAAACDPFDPFLGGRNPRPAAERFLAARPDIPPAEKDALLDRQPASPEVLVQLAGAPAREVRALVAANPSADSALLRTLAGDPDPAVRQYVATNPRAPRAILLALRRDEDQSVRWTVPGNPAWSGEDLRQMLEEGSADRSVLARNPSTPADILDRLARDGDYGVRSGLANNPSIGEAVADALARDPDPSIRVMLTYNPATPIRVLHVLARDSDARVRRYAAMALDRGTVRPPATPNIPSPPARP